MSPEKYCVKSSWRVCCLFLPIRLCGFHLSGQPSDAARRVRVRVAPTPRTHSEATTDHQCAAGGGQGAALSSLSEAGFPPSESAGDGEGQTPSTEEEPQSGGPSGLGPCKAPVLNGSTRETATDWLRAAWVGLVRTERAPPFGAATVGH